MSARPSAASFQTLKAGYRWRALIAAAALSGLSVSTVFAGEGSELLDKCSDTDASHVQTAMITGVAMGLLFGQALGGPKRAYCPPNDGRLSPGQYRMVACKFLSAHPRIARQEEYTAVGIALLESYPCSAEQK